MDSSRPTGAGGHLQHPFISAAGAGLVAFWFIPWDVVSNRDVYTEERIVSSRRNARETSTEVKALGRNKFIETLEIVSPLPPRSRKPVHQELVYVFRLSFIYMYICVPCGARLNRLVCNGPVSPLDIVPFCFAVLSRFVCHSVRKYTLLGLVYLVLLVLSLAISPPPLFRISIPEKTRKQRPQLPPRSGTFTTYQ